MFKRIVWLWFSSKWKNAKDVKNYISSLVEAWAEEFFTWYNPNYWHELFGFEVSPNGRFAEHEQITDFETLKQIVEEVHFHGFEIFLNLNAWYYTSETFPLIKKILEEILPLNFDWIICWNISILEYLKEINYNWKINLSTILALYNKESIKFFTENYNINKVILSRELTLKEIESLCKEFPNIDFEAFWEWDFCRYNNWLCFAEHKYGSKDICTVVVNDLIIKKKYKANYKKIILDKSLSNEEKVNLLDDSYKNPQEQIEEIIWKIEVWLQEEKDLLEELEKIILNQKNRVDLYFDAMKSFDDKQNKLVISILKWIKVLENKKWKDYPHLIKGARGILKWKDFVDSKSNWEWQTEKCSPFENKKILKKLKIELENSLKSWLSYKLKKEKELWWFTKLKSQELANFYGKNDNLNLYSYLFLSKIPNLVTVKFPTRWRSSTEKLNLIKETVKNWKPKDDIIDRSISLKRTHYDLTYIFSDKLRFRKMIKDL